MDTNENVIDSPYPIGEPCALCKLLVIREANELASLVLF